ncbi:MAG: DUF4113 domain-containing protein [Chlorobium sp.]
MQVMDRINERYGHGTVRLASENSVGWRPNQESGFRHVARRGGGILSR